MWVYLPTLGIDGHGPPAEVVIDPGHGIRTGDRLGLYRGDLGWVPIEAQAPAIFEAHRPKARVDEGDDDGAGALGSRTDAHKPAEENLSNEPLDARVLAIDYNAVGERHKEWKVVSIQVKEYQWEDWPLEGPLSLGHLVRNIMCTVRWVPSELNSADEPSRLHSDEGSKGLAHVIPTIRWSSAGVDPETASAAAIKAKTDGSQNPSETLGGKRIEEEDNCPCGSRPPRVFAESCDSRVIQLDDGAPHGKPAMGARRQKEERRAPATPPVSQ